MMDTLPFSIGVILYHSSSSSSSRRIEQYKTCVVCTPLFGKHESSLFVVTTRHHYCTNGRSTSTPGCANTPESTSSGNLSRDLRKMTVPILGINLWYRKGVVTLHQTRSALLRTGLWFQETFDKDWHTHRQFGPQLATHPSPSPTATAVYAVWYVLARISASGQSGHIGRLQSPRRREACPGGTRRGSKERRSDRRKDGLAPEGMDHSGDCPGRIQHREISGRGLPQAARGGSDFAAWHPNR